jgi:hypothetical protein
MGRGKIQFCARVEYPTQISETSESSREILRYAGRSKFTHRSTWELRREGRAREGRAILTHGSASAGCLREEWWEESAAGPATTEIDHQCAHQRLRGI